MQYTSISECSLGLARWTVYMKMLHISIVHEMMQLCFGLILPRLRLVCFTLYATHFTCTNNKVLPRPMGDIYIYTFLFTQHLHCACTVTLVHFKCSLFVLFSVLCLSVYVHDAKCVRYYYLSDLKSKVYMVKVFFCKHVGVLW